MSARDELAREIFIADNGGQPREASLKDWEALGRSTQAGKTYAHNIADGLIAGGWAKPRTIETVEELDALPVGSVIRTAQGAVSETQLHKDQPHWVRPGDGALIYASCNITLPATVLFEPAL